MQFEIRHINTTVRTLDNTSGAAHVELEELAQLVAMTLEQATAAADGRSLNSDDPAGELQVRS